MHEEAELSVSPPGDAGRGVFVGDEGRPLGAGTQCCTQEGQKKANGLQANEILAHHIPCLSYATESY